MEACQLAIINFTQYKEILKWQGPTDNVSHFSSLIIVQIRFRKTDGEVLIETQDDFSLYSYDFTGLNQFI